jgi:catechol 2,3-dioxygenase-like lactoylglutathione lyase family enzyme
MTTDAPTVTRTVPILRIFSVEKAKEFYVDYLGFTIDWEHRFGDQAPLYIQVSLGGLVLHLSEHHGDACPGSAVRIESTGVRAFHKRLGARNYRYLNPGVEQTPWGSVCVTLLDPFGNRLIFDEKVGERPGA